VPEILAISLVKRISHTYWSYISQVVRGEPWCPVSSYPGDFEYIDHTIAMEHVMNAEEQKILETVDSLRDDIIDFTLRLVAQPSTLGQEECAVQVMEEELQRLGFTTTAIPLDNKALAEHPGFAPTPWQTGTRKNIIGRRPAQAEGGKSALFNGHLDVVNAGSPELWSNYPFSPHIHDGWLYGRGAGDMKSGVAAMTYSVHALDKAGFGLCAPVTVEAVIEEECSGNGALACIAAGYEAEAVLIPEPFGPTILTDQVGVLWFKVSLSGKPTHVLEAPSGVNAIEKCYPLFTALRSLEARLNETNVPEAYKDMDHPLNLNIGMIEGGDWPSTVPSEASFHARLSYFPGTDYTTICNIIESTITKCAQQDPWLRHNMPRVEFYGFRSDGHSLSRDLPALTTLDQCHMSLTGKQAESYISTCTTDLRAFHWYTNSQPTCYGPIAENIHGIDERVNLESVMQVARTYALFLARWCKLYQ